MSKNRIRIEKYETRHKSVWDEFVAEAKNGTFLFYRDYMEYHADRFVDHSLLFFNDRKIIACMPLNEEADTVTSHGGLTFGGIVTDQKIHATEVFEIFSSLKDYLEDLGFKRLLYKAIPHIYHMYPAEEDLYVLFIKKARLIRRDISSVIFLPEKVNYAKGRKWSLKKGKKAELSFRRSYDFKDFMFIEEQNLRKKYGIRPTHTGQEMERLAEKFPSNIKLFASYQGDMMLAGVIIYEHEKVAHAQYIAATEQGKKLGALDLVLDFLISHYYVSKMYFDFGISTEKDGRNLNRGLIQNKETFGGRGIVYDFYEIKIAE